MISHKKSTTLYKRPPPCRPKPATICRWRCHSLADMQENAPWLTDMYTQGDQDPKQTTYIWNGPQSKFSVNFPKDIKMLHAYDISKFLLNLMRWLAKGYSWLSFSTYISIKNHGKLFAFFLTNIFHHVVLDSRWKIPTLENSRYYK